MKTLLCSTALLLLALMSSGCWGDSPPSPSPEDTYNDAGVDGGRECGMTFSPEPRLRELAEVETARWAKATGCVVSVQDEGGIAITLSDNIARPDGTQAPGVTLRRRDSPDDPWIIEQIQIHVHSEDKAASILHELGHALGADGHTAEDGVLSGSEDYTPIINEPSLTLLCSFVHCAAFVPEG